MGKEKYQKKVIELFDTSPVVNYSSIKRIIKNPEYTKQLVKNLVLKNKIRKLTKGFYTKYNESSLIVFCFKPAYLGLQDALSWHNLWEQETIPIVITTRKIRQGLREVNGMNVLIRRIDKRYLFGYDYFKQGEFYFPYSDIEKTFIDMVYFKQKIDNILLNEFKKKIDIKKLKGYLRRYPRRLSDKVSKLMK